MSPAQVARRNWPSMGSQASLMLAGTRTASEVAAAERLAADVLDDLEERFSSYRAESELSRFAAGEVDQPSGQLRRALAACQWLSDVSGGVFTTTTTHTYDLAGYVKGWVIQQAVEALAEAGFENLALGVGGDWQVHGSGPQFRPWRFGVVDPSNTARVRAVAVVAGALATSGTYERGEHLTRASGTASGVSTASFTVAGPKLEWADAFATIGYLKGEEGLAWVAQFPGYSGAIIRVDGSMVADDAFPLATGTAPQFPVIAAPYA